MQLSAREQFEILSRNTVEIIPEDEFLAKLELSVRKGKPLRVKLGCDPSAPDLHIGHSVVLGKLRQFQDLGHQAILVIGDFTAMIGDPSGRKKTRPALTSEETRRNAQSYVQQAGKILDIEKLEIRFNSEWLNPMSFADVIRLSAKYTVARMLERDDFSTRFKSGIPISIHEFLYPLAQAYDSVALQSDIELGGTDQKFNLLVGREIQQEYGLPPQAILTMPLIEGTDGVSKMSKSTGNYIAFEDSPDDMFGKVMSLPDNLIEKYLRLTVDIGQEELEKLIQKLSDSAVNPMEIKKRLAWELVNRYHGENSANSALRNFEAVFSRHEIPSDIPEFHLSEPARLIDILKSAGMVLSNSEARRLILQNAIEIGGETISDPNYILSPQQVVIKIGKRKWLKIVC